MWVIIDEANDETLREFLDNDPDEPITPLKAGDKIVFWRHQIINIDWKHPDSCPPSAVYRQYWDCCLVDQCVLDGLEPVEYLFREDPDLIAIDDKYPDSGWRIRGRMGARFATLKLQFDRGRFERGHHVLDGSQGLG